MRVRHLAQTPSAIPQELDFLAEGHVLAQSRRQSYPYSSLPLFNYASCSVISTISGSKRSGRGSGRCGRQIPTTGSG